MSDAYPPVTPPGWYQDPWGQAPVRWWDGATWTAHLGGFSPQQQDHPWLQTATAADARTLLAKERLAGKWLLLAGLMQAAITAVQGPLIAEFVEAIVNSGFSSSSSTTGVAMFQWQALIGAASLLQYGYIGVRIWWTYRVCDTGRKLGLRQRYDPGLTAASWIIPIVQYWFPYIGIRDAVRPDQRQPLLAMWWASCVILPYVGLVAGGLLAYFVSWQLGLLGGALVGLLHVLLERGVSRATLAAHQSSLGLDQL